MGQNASCCQEEADVPKEVIQPEVLNHCYEPGDDDKDADQAFPSAKPARPSQTHEGGHSLMKPHSGTSRLEQMKHLEVDTEIIRGISLRHSLRNWGRLWRWSPLDLKEEDRKNLWTKSKPVPGFDVFLSHTWMTPGRYKILTLLLRSGWRMGLLCWFIGAVLAMVLCMNDILPMPGTFTGSVPGFQNQHVDVGLWVMIFSFVGLLLGFYMSIFLPDAFSAADTCFLDVVSIHQTDEKLMERGIYGLGGFLKVSKELRVLWSPPYLSRLWCVFELAAYKMANPTGRITLTPLFIESVLMILFHANVCGAIVFHLLRWRKMGETWTYVGYCLGMIPSYKAWHQLRQESLNKHKLLSDLANFDLDNAECRSEFDRDFIHAGIVQWYGSKERFTRYVRGPLRAKLVGTAEFCIHIPLVYIILIATPSVTVGLEGFLSFWKAGAPAYGLVSFFFGKVIGINLFWQLISLKCGMALADRFAVPRWKGCFMNHMQTLLVFFAYFACYMFGAFLGTEATQFHIATSLCWLLFNLLLVGSFYRISKHYERLACDEASSACSFNFDSSNTPTNSTNAV